MFKTSILILLLSTSLFSGASIKEDFISSCGYSEKTANIYIKSAKKIKSFRSGFITQYKKKKKVETNYKNKTFNSPDINKAIEDYTQASSSGNPFPAYMSLNLILSSQMAAGATNIAKKNIRKVSQTLVNSKCCLGYVYLARSYTKELSRTAEYDKALNILNSGEKVCKSKKVGKSTKSAFLHAKARIKTYIKLTKKGRMKK